MATFAPRGIDPARDGENLTARFNCHVCSNQSTAGEVSLDYNSSQSHSCDNAIANWKALLVPLPVEWELRDDGARFRNPIEELLVLCRKDNVYCVASSTN